MVLDESIRVTILMKQYASRALKTYIQSSFRELIEATPVDTGWAQSNWLISAGRVPETVVGSKKQVDYGYQQESLRTIRQWQPEQGKLVIYNNVPYIGLLNEGYSSQAPAGFVEAILDKVAEEVQGSIR